MNFHITKVDGTGKWLQTGNAGSQSVQAAYDTDRILFVDVLTGAALIAGNASAPSLNAGTVCAGHHVMGFGTMMGRDCNNGKHSVWTLNDSSAIAEASEINLDSLSFPTCCDEHHSAQMQSTNAAYPFFTGSVPDSPGTETHNVATEYLANYMFATKNVAGANVHWKFCQVWSSGLQGFNSMVSGNVSPDGKFILFSSDMGVGVAVTSGQLGSTAGAGSCTDGVDCRTDAYICVTR